MRKGNVHIIDILGIVQEIVVCHNKDNTFSVKMEYHSDKILLSLYDSLVECVQIGTTFLFNFAFCGPSGTPVPTRLDL